MNILITIALTSVLLYVSVGLILMLWFMRGFKVSATLGEWLVLTLLWPIVIRLYILTSGLRSLEKSLKEWEKNDNGVS